MDMPKASCSKFKNSKSLTKYDSAYIRFQSLTIKEIVSHITRVLKENNIPLDDVGPQAECSTRVKHVDKILQSFGLVKSVKNRDNLDSLIKLHSTKLLQSMKELRYVQDSSKIQGCQLSAGENKFDYHHPTTSFNAMISSDGIDKAIHNNSQYICTKTNDTSPSEEALKLDSNITLDVYKNEQIKWHYEDSLCFDTDNNFLGFNIDKSPAVSSSCYELNYCKFDNDDTYSNNCNKTTSQYCTVDDTPAQFYNDISDLCKGDFLKKKKTFPNASSEKIENSTSGIQMQTISLNKPTGSPFVNTIQNNTNQQPLLCPETVDQSRQVRIPDINIHSSKMENIDQETNLIGIYSKAEVELSNENPTSKTKYKESSDNLFEFETQTLSKSGHSGLIPICKKTKGHYAKRNYKSMSVQEKVTRIVHFLLENNLSLQDIRPALPRSKKANPINRIMHRLGLNITDNNRLIVHFDIQRHKADIKHLYDSHYSMLNGIPIVDLSYNVNLGQEVINTNHSALNCPLKIEHQQRLDLTAELSSSYASFVKFDSINQSKPKFLESDEDNVESKNYIISPQNSISVGRSEHVQYESSDLCKENNTGSVLFNTIKDCSNEQPSLCAETVDPFLSITTSNNDIHNRRMENINRENKVVGICSENDVELFDKTLEVVKEDESSSNMEFWPVPAAEISNNGCLSVSKQLYGRCAKVKYKKMTVQEKVSVVVNYLLENNLTHEDISPALPSKKKTEHIIKITRLSCSNIAYENTFMTIAFLKQHIADIKHLYDSLQNKMAGTSFVDFSDIVNTEQQMLNTNHSVHNNPLKIEHEQRLDATDKCTSSCHPSITEVNSSGQSEPKCSDLEQLNAESANRNKSSQDGISNYKSTEVLDELSDLSKKRTVIDEKITPSYVLYENTGSSPKTFGGAFRNFVNLSPHEKVGGIATYLRENNLSVEFIIKNSSSIRNYEHLDNLLMEFLVWPTLRTRKAMRDTIRRHANSIQTHVQSLNRSTGSSPVNTEKNSNNDIHNCRMENVNRESKIIGICSDNEVALFDKTQEVVKEDESSSNMEFCSVTAAEISNNECMSVQEKVSVVVNYLLENNLTHEDISPALPSKKKTEHIIKITRLSCSNIAYENTFMTIAFLKQHIADIKHLYDSLQNKIAGTSIVDFSDIVNTEQQMLNTNHSVHNNPLTIEHEQRLDATDKCTSSCHPSITEVNSSGQSEPKCSDLDQLNAESSHRNKSSQDGISNYKSTEVLDELSNLCKKGAVIDDKITPSYVLYEKTGSSPKTFGGAFRNFSNLSQHEKVGGIATYLRENNLSVEFIIKNSSSIRNYEHLDNLLMEFLVWPTLRTRKAMRDTIRHHANSIQTHVQSLNRSTGSSPVNTEKNSNNDIHNSGMENVNRESKIIGICSDDEVELFDKTQEVVKEDESSSNMEFCPVPDSEISHNGCLPVSKQLYGRSAKVKYKKMTVQEKVSVVVNYLLENNLTHEDISPALPSKKKTEHIKNITRRLSLNITYNNKLIAFIKRHIGDIKHLYGSLQNKLAGTPIASDVFFNVNTEQQVLNTNHSAHNNALKIEHQLDAAAELNSNYTAFGNRSTGSVIVKHLYNSLQNKMAGTSIIDLSNNTNTGQRVINTDAQKNVSDVGSNKSLFKSTSTKQMVSHIANLLLINNLSYKVISPAVPKKNKFVHICKIMQSLGLEISKPNIKMILLLIRRQITNIKHLMVSHINELNKISVQDEPDVLDFEIKSPVTNEGLNFSENFSSLPLLNDIDYLSEDEISTNAGVQLSQGFCNTSTLNDIEYPSGNEKTNCDKLMGTCKNINNMELTNIKNDPFRRNLQEFFTFDSEWKT